MVKDASPEDVERAINNTRLLFVDASADWCQPCKALTPILEELEKKYAGNPDIRFLKVDTQLHHSFAMENQIYAIPCVLIFFNGEPAKYEVDDQRSGEKKILNRLIGLRPIEHYENVISFFFSDK
jgi:thioredoxin 1